MVVSGFVNLLSVILICSRGDRCQARSAQVGGRSELDKLQPPDHLDAVRMEQDGHLNKDFRKEVFLGDLEGFEDIPYHVRKAKFRQVFARADTNNDTVLVLEELVSWIQKKIEEHFAEGAKESDEIFKKLDEDGNGFLDWDEYYKKYVLARDFSNRSQLDYDNELLEKYKARWAEADTKTADNKLSKQEFLAFRHPEHREDTVNDLVKQVMNNLDKNKDMVITEKEFVDLPVGTVENKEDRQLEAQWQQEREKEFRTNIDINKDGNVTEQELKKYLNPRNLIQIHSEAESLMGLIDDNGDGKLSWEEVERHEAEFAFSKMVDTAKSFHDEF